ncbi:hypothetical protein I7I48_11323 [Histoplasma ohiense]|nr:hypothetical protein I7I48_11323 [Histoplasma ohiense (nom. inval.)]
MLLPEYPRTRSRRLLLVCLCLEKTCFGLCTVQARSPGVHSYLTRCIDDKQQRSTPVVIWSSRFKKCLLSPRVWLFVSQLELDRLWLMLTCLRERSFNFTNVFALPRLGFISHTIVPARITISF